MSLYLEEGGIYLKKLALLLIIGLVLTYLIACSNSSKENGSKENSNNPIDNGITSDNKETEVLDNTNGLEGSSEDDKVIYIMTANDVFDYNDIEKFKELHPDYDYEFKIIDLSMAHPGYEPILWDSLMNDSKEYGGVHGFVKPDIYIINTDYAMKYIQGDAYHLAASYKDLGIDIDTLIKEAQVSQYYIDIGTNPEGELIALGFENIAGAFIYRRSIAKEVWGTDDPLVIGDIIGPGWDKFFLAAEDLRERGYGICSGIEDIWLPVEFSSKQPWVVDGKLYIDPNREAYLDLAKNLIENDYTNNSRQWLEKWYIDIEGESEKAVFGFFGPPWFLNYVLMPLLPNRQNEWAVCNPPYGFFYYGTMVLAHKDTKYKELVGEFIKWVTLDTSENGYQYLWANEYQRPNPDVKRVAALPAVMDGMDGSFDFIGGQDIYEAYISAAKLARGDNYSVYDLEIGVLWKEEVLKYARGKKSRDQAIDDFKQKVKEKYVDLIVE